MKGQIVSADFVVAFVVFIGLVIGLMSSWDSLSTSIEEFESRNSMERISMHAADLIVMSQGVPSNWSSSNVESIGLAKHSFNMISRGKLNELLMTDYSRAKSGLGIPFDFYLEFNTTGLVSNYTTYGIAPSSASNVMIVRRLYLLDGNEGIMTLRVWE